jgi:hypothetical protein
MTTVLLVNHHPLAVVQFTDPDLVHHLWQTNTLKYITVNKQRVRAISLADLIDSVQKLPGQQPLQKNSFD